MSEAENTVNDGAEEPQSAEDKFFGVRTQIGQQSQDKAEEASDLDIEIVDDRPPEDRRPPRAENAGDGDIADEELEGYSDKVRKRIDKLRYEQHEERRQREAAERMREEAVNVAQQLAGKNREYEALIQRGEGALISQVKERARLSLDRAKSSYRQAYEEGDTDKVVEAQEGLLRAQTELSEAERYERNLPPQPDPNAYAQQQAAYQQQVAQQQQAAYAAAQQAQQQPAEPDPKAAAWAERNDWFGDPTEKVMSAAAYALHEEALNDHELVPNSEDYFQYIDTGMRQHFPDYSWSDESGDGLPAPATTRRATSVVAPSARNNGARPRKVQLTSTQVSLAKKLGITPQQYAAELAKETGNV